MLRSEDIAALLTGEIDSCDGLPAAVAGMFCALRAAPSTSSGRQVPIAQEWAEFLEEEVGQVPADLVTRTARGLKEQGFRPAFFGPMVLLLLARSFKE